MIRPLTFALLVCTAFISCSPSGKKDEKEEMPFGPTGIPPHLRAKSLGGTPISPGGNIPSQGLKPPITPDEQIVFTDPDNPDASLPELSTLLKGPEKGPWEESDTIARQRASREGKPLLIWFTDSNTSPMCKALNAELFNTPKFEDWAKDKLVRLKVDANSSKKFDNMTLGEQEDMNIRRKAYVTEMKKRYKVLGQPTLLILSPGGEVVGRYRGYKRGQADFTWGLLKQGEVVASNSYRSWRKDMEKKGYREWQDTKGRKVFAKLQKYHEGELVFLEPDGTRSKTKETRLSETDRAWIAQQKALRGIR
jgi:thioredoxin-related protein